MVERFFICRTCGRIFANRHDGVKLCDDCIECKSGHRVDSPSDGYEKPKRKKKNDGGLSVDEISKLADSAHMSYGQYVALHKL